MNTLLIVDDESWTRDTVKALIDDSLEISQIVEATNGEEAIELIKSANPDFIITDMKMPGIDGIRLLEVLEKDYPEIPAIVLSGYQDFVYTRQAIKSGVIEYLPKPVDETELNTALKKAIYRKREKEQEMLGYQLITVKRPEIKEIIDPLRQKLMFSFKELNASQLSKSILQFLESVDAELQQDPSFIAHLHQTFLRLIEEAMEEHKLRFSEIDVDLSQLTYQRSRSLEKELMNQLTVGEQVISRIEEIRKQKTKINLDDIKHYLDENSTSPNMSLEIIAKKYFVSKEYLTTAFKKRYGCNVTEYIIQTRMEKAKELIMTTTLQYKTIAEMVGYDDVSYFYRVFKKYYKTSPGKIRENI